MTSRNYVNTVGISLIVVSALLHIAGLFRNTFGCESRGIRHNEFVAYCENDRYTDYEHGALYYALEPGVVDAMKAADVLFFGSSRLQLGIDPELLAARMSAARIRYYVLAFGYKEQFRFPLALIERYRLKPKAVVINADPFFEDTLSAVSKPLIEKGFGEPRLGYLYRRALQRMKSALCESGSALAGSRACVGYRLTLFRSRETGSWRLPTPINEGNPLQLPAPDAEGASKAIGLAANARQFMRKVDVRPGCTIIVGVPSSMVPPNIAPTVARELRARYVAADVSRLMSFDRSHLTTDSAKRWSEAFLNELQPELEACLHRSSR